MLLYDFVILKWFIIVQVIRASKLEAHKVVLNFVNFKPYELLESTVSLYTNDLAVKRIALDLKLGIINN